MGIFLHLGTYSTHVLLSPFCRVNCSTYETQVLVCNCAISAFKKNNGFFEKALRNCSVANEKSSLAKEVSLKGRFCSKLRKTPCNNYGVNFKTRKPQGDVNENES